MKQSFSKREKIIIIAATLLVIFAIAWIGTLYQSLQSKDYIIESNSVLLREKDRDANKTSTYIETICAEYRKLYQTYREARFPDPASVDKYVGLPGSAKGQIDDCYLPD